MWVCKLNTLFVKITKLLTRSFFTKQNVSHLGRGMRDVFLGFVKTIAFYREIRSQWREFSNRNNIIDVIRELSNGIQIVEKIFLNFVFHIFFLNRRKKMIIC